MDRSRISAICHGDLPFHNPLAPALVDQVLGHAGLSPTRRVLDVGCGPGELLIRAVERFGCTGIGVDLDAGQIAAARRRAAARVPHAGLTFVAQDARAGTPPGGPFDLVACIGSMHAVDGGLAELARLAGPRGRVLVGHGFWRRTPPPAYLAALGATADELTDYDGLVGAGADAGLEAVYAAVADDADWDRYEWTLIANGLRWAAAHPDDPLAEAVAARARAARARVVGEGGRDTLGFALVLFAPR